MTSPTRWSSGSSPSTSPENTPSEAYLTLSNVPSTTLSSPTRKLLVLDLNGTLLLRSPRASQPPRSARGRHTLGPTPRGVMPRPYLSALRSYFFAPLTRAWLDVMVWSSAQPHNVDDMIWHTFGRDRAKLVAVWARDTLVFSEDYHRNVQTIKDLERPWAALASQEQGDASPSSVASSPHASPGPEPVSEPTRLSYTASTTILLDDSPAKAALQPYNHLCVREYTHAQRNADLAALALGPRSQHPQSAPIAALETTPVPDGDEEAAGVHHSETGHKRKRSQEPEKEDLPLERQRQRREEEEGEGLDETLLAVIGILHAARLQSNIAGWRRGGALRPQLERGGEWFEDPALVSEWACRGREAMSELGFDVEHGVEP